jgi:hypothetical protein
VKIAISQPGYLPWAGFFDLIDQVDKFVLLDDAQFVKRSWDQRNRIKGPSGLQWLTVPVMVRGHFKQALPEVQIQEPRFWEKHLRAIKVNYSKARYFDNYFETLQRILQEWGRAGKLIDLNIALIQWLAGELGVTTPMLRSSTLGVEGKRSGRLASLCSLLGASDYVSPRSATYLLDDLSLFTANGLTVWFQNYTHPEYEQRFPPFVSHASVLDLLLNKGPESGAIMRSGRGQPFTPEQVRLMSAECEAPI